MRQAFFKPAARSLLGLALLAASGVAMALGLGEIRVKSSPGQPLLAEIPVISSDPSELEQLRAQLASPVVFERVGLQRPTGLVSQLDFAVALSGDGQPVIRVTSQDPVDTPSVNFLVEVDWGQGRLVREYSALVGTPGALAAADAPQIQAPSPSPSNLIERSAPVAPTPPVAQSDAAGHTEPASGSVPTPRSPALAAMADVNAVDTVTVARGQSLSQIARSLYPGGGLDQTMVALLRANPEAFVGHNINRLRADAVLHVPANAEIAALAETEAAAMVRQQVAEWRQARRTVLQPAGVPPVSMPRQVVQGLSAAPGARLEIAPPAADVAQRAGTTSGTDAGGEGEMLANEQLRQTQEDLAARNAEVRELRTQVAELEMLKAQQAQLIVMKDSDLATAQKRLGDGQHGVGVPAWLWIGAMLIIVGLLAWVLLRRQRPVPLYKGALASPPLADIQTGPSALQESNAGPAMSDPATSASTAGPLRHIPVGAFNESAVGKLDAPPLARTPAWMQAATAKPTWHAVRDRQSVVETAQAGTRPVSGQAPGLAAPTAASAQVAAATAGHRERLELAIAYLDLGDTDAARSLLREIAAGGDPLICDEAEKFLRELG